MANPENVKRNDKIFALSKRGGGVLSVRELMRMYGFKSTKTIFNIIETGQRRKQKKLV